MAQRPQGCKTAVVTTDTQIVATTVKNKNVYCITVNKIDKGGASLVDEKIAIRDSVAGTIRWSGRIKSQYGDHFLLGRYGINCPQGIYIQFTGGNAAVTVVWD